jgi:cytochrome c553
MKYLYSLMLVFSFFGCQNSAPNSKYEQNTAQDNIKAKELFHTCQKCHGNKGELHALGKSDIIAYYKRDEIVEALTAYQNGKREKHRFGFLMKGIVADFSKHDIQILANYISQIKDQDK